MKTLVVKSHRGPYTARWADASRAPKKADAYIVDAKVWQLHGQRLAYIKKKPHLIIPARETNKTLRYVTSQVLPFLKDNGVNRSSMVVAIGGGIVQDIASFAASIFMRGIPWTLYPTTFLAQSDSCIGSKSSINLDKTKNMLGTFYPAEQVVIDHRFLETLTNRDIVSGIGEIVKVHFLKGKNVSLALQADLPFVRARQARALDRALYQSLLIKKEYVEQDEFDTGVRNLLNYGHCFGHALEAGSNYGIVHGIGVLYGMEVANRLSLAAGYISETTYQQMRAIIWPLLIDRQRARATTFAAVLPHLKKDKKNVAGKISFILTHGFGKMKKHQGIKPSDIRHVWDTLLTQL